MSDQDYNEATYGDNIAGVYDKWHPEAPGDMIDTLKDLAGAGPALELGIGTGRVALPLAARGLEVHGIDASEAMVAKLRSRPGGDHIPVTIGNFADVGVHGTYSLIFVVFNTFFSLASQEEQVNCFANIAGRLNTGGLFVIEAFIPDPTRFTHGQVTRVTDISADEVRLEVSKHDSLQQRTMSHHLVITEAGVKLYPIQVRYAWLAELDLMARLAGMRLRDRWSNWRREPLAQDSLSHISVYELIRPIS
jgi:SAM-dependent methyltransferase